MIRPRGFLRLRCDAFLVIALLCAFPGTARGQCYEADGREVWIERHLRTERAADGLVPVQVRFAPDTSGKVYRTQRATLRIMAEPNRRAEQPIHVSATAKTPAIVRLQPGSYRFILYSITYETATHFVEIASNDSIIVEAQLRGAAYCVESMTPVRP